MAIRQEKAIFVGFEKIILQNMGRAPSERKNAALFFSCCKTLHVANLTKMGYNLKKVSKAMKVPQFGTKEHPIYLICDFSSRNIISFIFFFKRFLRITVSLNSPFFC